jgi:CBS domain-containing protein
MEMPYDIEHPLAKDIMTPGVYQINADASLVDALTMMYERRISGLLVFEKQKNQYFVITHKDIVTFLYHNTDHPIRLKDYKVNMLMEGPVEFIDPELPLDLLIRYLLTYGYRRVFVGRDNIPMGVISMMDILQWSALYFKPAKPLVFMILNNNSGIIIGKYIFKENIPKELDSELIDLIGGAFSSISNIIEEVISGSGRIREVEKENYKVLFEQREYITGILFSDNKSLELRHRLHLATNAFCERFIEDINKIRQKKDVVETRNLDEIVKEYFLSTKINTDIINTWKSA